MAVMVCEPTSSALVVNVATPEAFSVPVPSDVAPSKNSALPAGVPVPGEFTVTVAVKVTDWPNVDGLTDEVSVRRRVGLLDALR